MKLAIVCDDLIQYGGAEKVFEAVAEIFPEAPIYTSVASKKWLKKLKGRKVITSFFQKFPFSVKLNRYYSPFFLHTLAFESFNFSEFDIVLSLSSRYAHHIVTKPQTKHICYMHSPGRMFWESHDYFENETYGILRPIKKLAPWFLKYPLSFLRALDFNKAQKVDKFIANSEVTKARIRKYFNRESEIINPFANLDLFFQFQLKQGDYYLVLTRLSPWKRVDIAVEACSNLNLPLKIIGDGPDRRRLESMAGPSCEFLGYIDDEEKAEVISNCRAVIITQKEDFGIVPLEAMACGKSVLAYKDGGSTETVLDGLTGRFFDEQTSESLEKVLKIFNERNYDSNECKNRAKEFSKEKFQEKLKNIIMYTTRI
ncbi:glycosyltransferase [Patescibacteria group bacterium]